MEKNCGGEGTEKPETPARVTAVGGEGEGREWIVMVEVDLRGKEV